MNILDNLTVPDDVRITALPLVLTFAPVGDRALERIREEEACLEVRHAVNLLLYAGDAGVAHSDE